MCNMDTLPTLTRQVVEVLTQQTVQVHKCVNVVLVPRSKGRGCL
jgi:hypothetical protein